jgi:hypothetical protein
MSADTWSDAELILIESLSSLNDSIGQPVETFTDDEEIINYFSEGQCGALAYELHKLTGWTLAMVSSSPAGSPDYTGHLFVMDSEGMVIDIKGRRTLEAVQDEWYMCGYVHRFFTLKEFEYELIEWEMSPRFDRDSKARQWARHIYRELH